MQDVGDEVQNTTVEIIKAMLVDSMKSILVWIILAIPGVVFILLFYLKSQSNKRRREQHYMSISRAQTRHIENTYDQKSIIGLQFEIQVAEKLKNCGFANVFRDIKFVEEGCGSVQIDVVAVTGEAIFVLECKNWSGKIFGSSGWSRWLKVDGFRSDGRYGADRSQPVSALEVYSPIWQNYRHVTLFAQRLKKQLSVIPPIYNIVVFSDISDISCVSSESECIITTFSRLEHELQMILSSVLQQPIGTPEDIAQICNDLRRISK